MSLAINPLPCLLLIVSNFTSTPPVVGYTVLNDSNKNTEVYFCGPTLTAKEKNYRRSAVQRYRMRDLMQNVCRNAMDRTNKRGISVHVSKKPQGLKNKI